MYIFMYEYTKFRDIAGHNTGHGAPCPYDGAAWCWDNVCKHRDMI